MATEMTNQNGDLFNEALIQSYVSRDKNPRFLARLWLAERVEAALKEDNCRFVLLTAEPGAGKTVFMAWLANECPAGSACSPCPFRRGVLYWFSHTRPSSTPTRRREV